MSRDCPRCGLISPDEALRCDCGYDFATNTIQPSYLVKHQCRKSDTGSVWAAIGLLGVVNIVAIVQTGNASFFFVTLGLVAMLLRSLRPDRRHAPGSQTNDDGAQEDAAQEDAPEPAS